MHRLIQGEIYNVVGNSGLYIDREVLSIAYDSVGDVEVLNDMKDIGSGGVAFDWFLSYLTDSSQVMKIGNIIPESNKYSVASHKAPFLDSPALCSLLQSQDMSYHIYSDYPLPYLIFEARDIE